LASSFTTTSGPPAEAAVPVYQGFTEHTCWLVFPFEHRFGPDTPQLLSKVLEPRKEKGLIAFAYTQSISDELQFEKHLRLTPGEQCFVYRKDAEFHQLLARWRLFGIWAFSNRQMSIVQNTGGVCVGRKWSWPKLVLAKSIVQNTRGGDMCSPLCATSSDIQQPLTEHCACSPLRLPRIEGQNDTDCD